MCNSTDNSQSEQKTVFLFLVAFAKQGSIENSQPLWLQDEQSLTNIHRLVVMEEGLSKTLCASLRAHPVECQLVSFTTNSVCVFVQKAIKQSIWLIEP